MHLMEAVTGSIAEQSQLYHLCVCVCVCVCVCLVVCLVVCAYERGIGVGVWSIRRLKHVTKNERINERVKGEGVMKIDR